MLRGSISTGVVIGVREHGLYRLKVTLSINHGKKED